MKMSRESLDRALDAAKFNPEKHIHNTTLLDITKETRDILVRVDEVEMLVHSFGSPSFDEQNVGKIGSICFRRGFKAVEEQGFVFMPYVDQSLRRAPELDHIERDGKAVYGWICDKHKRGMYAPPTIIPGKDGRWIAANSEKIALDVPSEFLEQCLEVGLSPVNVLRGFIADLCSLQNYMRLPREDGYSSNGSDERNMAEEYFNRAYGIRREEQAKFLRQKEIAQEAAEERQQNIDEVESVLHEYLEAGGEFSEFLKAISEIQPPAEKT